MLLSATARSLIDAMSDPLYPPSSDGIDSSFLQRASGQHAGDRTAIDEDSLYECDAPRYADLRQEMEGEMPMTGGTPRMRQKPDGWFGRNRQ